MEARAARENFMAEDVEKEGASEQDQERKERWWEEGKQSLSQLESVQGTSSQPDPEADLPTLFWRSLNHHTRAGHAAASLELLFRFLARLLEYSFFTPTIISLFSTCNH